MNGIVEYSLNRETGGKLENPEKKPWSKDYNQQQTSQNMHHSLESQRCTPIPKKNVCNMTNVLF